MIASSRRGESSTESPPRPIERVRSEEHTSELQSLAYLVCRLLLEKKNRQRDPRGVEVTHVEADHRARRDGQALHEWVPHLRLPRRRPAPGCPERPCVRLGVTAAPA